MCSETHVRIEHMLASLMKTTLFAVGNWNTWLLIPWGKLCFRSDSPGEVELSVIPEELVVVVDGKPLPSEPPKGPSPGLDIETSVINCVDDADQVEGEIPAGCGMYDHRESYRDS